MELPPDFDSAVYLEMNPDVKQAGIPAAEHYLEYGEKEKRTYLRGDLRHLCLRGLDIFNGTGLEIGALDRPLLTADKGRVFFADHLSSDDLKLKYSGRHAVDLDKICDVDFNLSQEPLSRISRRFDFVVASHVIEHVPDLVGWLKDIETLLKPGGILALVVPDKHFTFDFFRRVTTAEVVRESIGNTRPSLRQVLDFQVNAVKADAGKLWENPETALNMKPLRSVDYILNKAAMHAAGHYIDVHCWVFTPNSFCRLMEQLFTEFRLDLAISRFEETHRNQLEFYVQIRKGG